MFLARLASVPHAGVKCNWMGVPGLREGWAVTHSWPARLGKWALTHQPGDVVSSAQGNGASEAPGGGGGGSWVLSGPA